MALRLARLNSHLLEMASNRNPRTITKLNEAIVLLVIVGEAAVTSGQASFNLVIVVQFFYSTLSYVAPERLSCDTAPNLKYPSIQSK